ncbi:hypothetical protein [Pseudomonas sp. Ant30-3]|uniref:hypothetical protein n=1 Tax=Pseudomonas sp. Ant30-3 TaxID=1488328 RepID=UPI0004919189|nr:hypothetical protein [Pseudomonas sp. Ant30-3]
MRSLILDMPNGRELIDELDLATELMMSIPVDQVGGQQWQDAFDRQQRAFAEWRKYLLRLADGRLADLELQVA